MFQTFLIGETRRYKDLCTELKFKCQAVDCNYLLKRNQRVENCETFSRLAADCCPLQSWQQVLSLKVFLCTRSYDSIVSIHHCRKITAQSLPQTNTTISRSFVFMNLYYKVSRILFILSTQCEIVKYDEKLQVSCWLSLRIICSVVAMKSYHYLITRTWQ